MSPVVSPIVSPVVSPIVNGATQYLRSQFGEDAWCLERRHELGLPDRGFFVEFGAGDGERCSNTYWLEHGMGWRGLLCEPDPRQAGLERARPGSIVERVAVGPPGPIGIGLCEDPELSGELRVRAPARDPRMRVRETVLVDQVPLGALLMKHSVSEVHVLSVDTEGTEIAALRTLDWSTWRPLVCVVEHETWGIGSRLDETRDFMRELGYDLRHTTQCNGIYVDSRSYA